jgi:predicted nuclease of predicted toxin-antitoxin system
VIGLDAQLSPALAPWIEQTFSEPCLAVRDVGLKDAEDLVIFNQAKVADVIVMTKDRDFVELLLRYGPPPQIIWLTCGNTSNANLKSLLTLHLASALSLLSPASPLVEIR